MTISKWWSDMSEARRIDLVGYMVGAWSFGGVQMCFAMLPKEAKVKLYEVFVHDFDPQVAQS